MNARRGLLKIRCLRLSQLILLMLVVNCFFGIDRAFGQSDSIIFLNIDDTYVVSLKEIKVLEIDNCPCYLTPAPELCVKFNANFSFVHVQMETANNFDPNNTQFIVRLKKLVGIDLSRNYLAGCTAVTGTNVIEISRIITPNDRQINYKFINSPMVLEGVSDSCNWEINEIPIRRKNGKQ